MDLLLDISRTVARARHARPSGIDRVERAYIDWALGQGARYLCRIGRRLWTLDGPAVRDLVTWLENEAPAPLLDLPGLLAVRSPLRLRRAHALIRRAGQRVGRTGVQPDGVGIYLNVGHDNLAAGDMTSLANSGWRTVVMVHDTIPLDQPEYARRGTSERFRTKLAGMALADAVVCNSADTERRLSAHMPKLTALCHVLPLGITPSVPIVPQTGPPAFVILGTIEPRKNHLLLLDLWAKHWSRTGPTLHIVGRRGWENAEVFRLMDSHPMMGRTVIEHGAISDAETRAILMQSRALLFPSFAEGFGLPLAEALTLGVPVIASDLPALREIGRSVPEWLAPDDASGWAEAIRDFTNPDAMRRVAQLQRLSAWSPPTWAGHFDALEDLLKNLLETNLVHPDEGS